MADHEKAFLICTNKCLVEGVPMEQYEADSGTQGGRLTALENGKVDKVSGKALSTNDYTDADKDKLEGIAAGAEVNVNADWNATSGDSQILNKPRIPEALSELSEDASHRIVTDAEKSTWNAKQVALVSGQNIKTVNGESILGSGNLDISNDNTPIVKYSAYNYPVPVMAGDEYSTDGGQTWNTVEADGQLAYPFTGLVRNKVVASGIMPAYERSETNHGHYFEGTPIITSGKVATTFQLGGKGYICSNSTAVDVYDENGNTTAGTAMSLSGGARGNRNNHVSFVLGNKAYVLTVKNGTTSGDVTSNSSSALDVYDENGNKTNLTFDAGTITISGDTIWYSNHCVTTSFVIGDKAYIFIYNMIYGDDRNIVENTHTKVVDSNGVITEGTALPTGKYDATSFVIDDKGFICGENKGNSSIDLTVYTYDSNGVVSTATSIPTVRTSSSTGYDGVYGMVSFALGDTGYVCGGYYSYYSSSKYYSSTNRVLKYDYEGNVTTGSNMTGWHAYVPALVVGDKAWIGGGTYEYDTYTYNTNVVDVIDSNGVVTAENILQASRGYTGALVFNDVVHIVGGFKAGYSSDTSYNVVDIYYPDDLYTIVYNAMIPATQYSERVVDGVFTFMESSSKEEYTKTLTNIYLKDDVPQTWQYRIKYKDGIIPA